MDSQSKSDSIREIVERNEQGITLISQTVLELAHEIKRQQYKYKPSEKSPLEMITAQLEDYIHVRCGSCTIREKLVKLEGDEQL